MAAIGVDDKDFGQRLRAFVVLESGKKKGRIDELWQLRAGEPRALQGAREIVFIDELPRNATGKVLKRELVEEEEEEKAAK